MSLLTVSTHNDSTLDVATLLQPHIQQFIHDHEDDDPYQLSLQAHRYPDLPVPAIVQQIQTRQKARRKLPEWYAIEGILFPPVLSMEQCSSQATAQFKQRLVQGNRLLDLTGGAGVDTYYLGQSFEQVDYVEQRETLTTIARHNFAQLRASQIRTHTATAEDFLSNLAAPVDCIYLDPARRDNHQQRVFQLADCQPNVVALRDLLLAKARRILLKTAPLLDIQATVQALGHVAQVHVVAVANEVKEVLYTLTQDKNYDPEITAVNLRATSEERFSFRRSQEAVALATYAAPLRYLYEPHAALMKAGAFSLIAQRFGLHKLHPNTHLYTAEHRFDNFPGRTFRCRAVVPYQKKAVLQHLAEPKANITTRNFPDSVATLRKKLGLREGGDEYLFAVRSKSNNLSIIICSKHHENIVLKKQ